MTSPCEHAGGGEAIHRLEEVFYRKVLADPILKPLFGEGRSTHVNRLTAFVSWSYKFWPVGPTRSDLLLEEPLAAVHLEVPSLKVLVLL